MRCDSYKQQKILPGTWWQRLGAASYEQFTKKNYEVQNDHYI
jgi:hypothetical protein